MNLPEELKLMFKEIKDVVLALNSPVPTADQMTAITVLTEGLIIAYRMGVSDTAGCVHDFLKQLTRWGTREICGAEKSSKS